MWFLLLALLLQDAREPASIEGAVLHGASGDPLKRAQVYLTQANSATPPRSATTDAAGRYLFAGLEPGTYYLAAERDGFVRQEFGQKAPGRPPRALTVSKGLRLQDISFKLLPTAVITGRVLNEDGEKLAHATVMAVRQSVTRGRKEFVPVNTVNTNDLGDYRLFGLSPGRYYVAAYYNRNNRGGITYPPVSYPNAPDIGRATPVDVTAGGEATGIDFQLTAARTATIRGRVIARTNAGAILAGSVTLTLKDGLKVLGGYNTQLSPDGAFELRNIPPGSYWLAGQAHSEGRSLMGRMVLEVGDGPVDAVSLTLQPPLAISGRVTFEGQLQNPAIGMAVMAENLETGLGSAASLDAKYGFSVDNLAAMEYFLDVRGLPRDFYVKSVTAGREELLDRGLNLSNGSAGPVEIVVSPKAAQLDGAVTHDSNPFQNATIVLVPEGLRRARSRFFKFATTDAAGRFSLHSITPGDYKLFAWEYVPGGNFEDPEFLAKHESRGKAITLREQARESVNVTLIPDE